MLLKTARIEEFFSDHHDMHKQLECFFVANNNRSTSMTGLTRRCRDLKKRTCKIIFAWHLAEYLNDVELVTRSS